MPGGRWLLVLATTAGIAAAAVVTLLQDSTYRADASVLLVREGRPPGSDPKLAGAARAAAELFDSRAVAESAIRNLGLDESPRALLDRVEVEAATDSSLVRIEVEAPRAEEARRTAQELSEVATVLFNDRFSPQTVASVWEPASADDEPVSPDPARNLALGVLLGALAGWGILLFRVAKLPRRRAAEPIVAPGKLVVPVVAETGTRSPEPPRADPAVPAVSTAPAAPPTPEPYVEPEPGEWTVGDVERLVAEHGDAFPELEEELTFYLDAIRDVAGANGGLPRGVQGIIEENFRDLIVRARRVG